MDGNIRKIGIALSAPTLLLSTVSAEITKYRAGDLMTGLIDVLGYNLLDILASFQEIIIFILILVIAYYFKPVWRKLL